MFKMFDILDETALYTFATSADFFAQCDLRDHLKLTVGLLDHFDDHYLACALMAGLHHSDVRDAFRVTLVDILVLWSPEALLVQSLDVAEEASVFAFEIDVLLFPRRGLDFQWIKHNFFSTLHLQLLNLR